MSLSLTAHACRIWGPGILPIRQPVRELMGNSKGQLGQFHRLAEEAPVPHQTGQPSNRTTLYSPEFGLQIICGG